MAAMDNSAKNRPPNLGLFSPESAGPPRFFRPKILCTKQMHGKWRKPRVASGTKIISDLFPTQPCLICGRTPTDPHHLRFVQSRAVGRKVSDEWVVALCRGHHREVHRHGDERDWWEKPGLAQMLPHEVCGCSLILRLRFG
jgi:hypothetical protein